MLKYSRICWLFWLTFFSAQSLAADVKPLEVGIFPYISARALLNMYQPVRLYLEKTLHRPVQFYTAPDFKAFIEHTQRGEYDLILTAPHFARLAQTDAGYVPLLGYTKELRGVVVVAKNSPISSLYDLRGKTIALPNRLALVSITGLQLLHDNLPPDNKLQLVTETSHSNALLSVQRGDSDAAITEMVVLSQMPAGMRNSVRILATTVPLSQVMYLGHPRLGEKYLQQIKAALLQFAASPSGEAFLEASGYDKLQPIPEASLKSMDPYVKELKRLLEQTQ